jgi:hypothetical protein
MSRTRRLGRAGLAASAAAATPFAYLGDDQGGLDRRVELAGAQPGADPGVAAADHQQPHRLVPWRRRVPGGQAPAGTSSASSRRTRASMSSRMRRTTSTGWPAGSWSSQSS